MLRYQIDNTNVTATYNKAKHVCIHNSRHSCVVHVFRILWIVHEPDTPALCFKFWLLFRHSTYTTQHYYINYIFVKMFIKSYHLFVDFPYVSTHFSSTTTFITTKQGIECKNFLMFATIGVIVVALIVVVLYIYTWMLERRLLASGVI